MNIAIFWKPFQWVLEKLWEIGMRLWPKPKSAVEKVADVQLRERDIEASLPAYMQQFEFAFMALAHEHPAANAMSLAALAKTLDTTPAATLEIIRALMKTGQIASFRSPGPLGETVYRLIA